MNTFLKVFLTQRLQFYVYFILDVQLFVLHLCQCKLCPVEFY
ncbi:hypothetical protein [Spiroplasma endosymbiont of Aleiodes alternator]